MRERKKERKKERERGRDRDRDRLYAVHAREGKRREGKGIEGMDHIYRGFLIKCAEA